MLNIFLPLRTPVAGPHLTWDRYKGPPGTSTPSGPTRGEGTRTGQYRTFTQYVSTSLRLYGL